MASITLTHYSDPSHGWLRVPHSLIARTGTHYLITSYSYRTDRYAYLEEDMDATTLLNALDKAGVKYSVKSKWTDRRSHIRNYRPYHTADLG